MTLAQPHCSTFVEHTEGDTVGAIVLNRPEHLNAAVALMTKSLNFTWIRQHEIKVVVMLGEGRAFTAV